MPWNDFDIYVTEYAQIDYVLGVLQNFCHHTFRASIAFGVKRNFDSYGIWGAFFKFVRVSAWIMGYEVIFDFVYPSYPCPAPYELADLSCEAFWMKSAIVGRVLRFAFDTIMSEFEVDTLKHLTGRKICFLMPAANKPITYENRIHFVNSRPLSFMGRLTADEMRKWDVDEIVATHQSLIEKLIRLKTIMRILKVVRKGFKFIGETFVLYQWQGKIEMEYKEDGVVSCLENADEYIESLNNISLEYDCLCISINGCIHKMACGSSIRESINACAKLITAKPLFNIEANEGYGPFPSNYASHDDFESMGKGKGKGMGKGKGKGKGKGAPY